MNLKNMLPTDNGRLKCVVNGLPPLGQQLAVDTTLVSPVKGNGEPRPKADREDGVALAEARRTKEARYPELVTGTRCKLVVTAMETGGRWSEEAHWFLETLAHGRARDAPRALRGAVFQACVKRWTAMLAVAGMRSLADTLLHDSARTTHLHEGEALTVGQLLAQEPRC